MLKFAVKVQNIAVYSLYSNNLGRRISVVSLRFSILAVL